MPREVTPEEEWRDVVGWEGYYQVSSSGRFRSVDRTCVGSDGRIRRDSGRIMTGYIAQGGYPRVRLTRNGQSSARLLHCLVAEAFLGPRPEGLEVCHYDGDPSNSAVSNLRYDTRIANMQDMVRHGRGEVAKTHCPRGHVLEFPNLVRCIASRGYRECLACSRARACIRHYGGGDLQSLSDQKYLDIMKGAVCGVT